MGRALVVVAVARCVRAIGIHLADGGCDGGWNPVDHDVAEVVSINDGTKLKFTTTKDNTRAGGFLVAFSLPLEHCDIIVTLPAKK